MAFDQTIKQRLIGAIVLVAIAVIFLPGILGQKTQRKSFVSQVPEHNSIKLDMNKLTDDVKKVPVEDIAVEKDVPPPKSSPKVSEKPPSSSKQESQQANLKNSDSNLKTEQKPESKPEKSVVESKVESKKESTETFKRASWLIQVGSFSSHANAELLSKKLEQQGMKSFVRPVNLEKDKLLYRVFVGPWLDKSKAEAALSKVEDITRLKPIVIQWSPNKH